MGKAAGRVVQSLVFLHTAAPLTASATPSPGLSFDYESEHLEHQRSPTAQGLSKSKMWLNSGRVLDSLKPNLPRRLGTAAKDLGSGLCSNKTQTLPPFFPTLTSTSRQALEPRCLQADVVMLGLRIS